MVDKLVEAAETSARGGFFLFAGNTLSTFILSLGYIIVARFLGPENFGLYSLSMVAPSVFLLFTDLGLNTATTRFSAKLRAEGKPHVVARMVRSAFIFSLVIALVMSTLCFILSDSFGTMVLNRSDIGYLIRLGFFLVFFQATYSIVSSAFLGLDRMQDNALIMNIQSIVEATMSPLLIVFFGLGVVGAVSGHILGYMIAGTVGSLILLDHYRRLCGAQKGDSFQPSIRMMLSYGFPLYASSLFAGIQWYCANIILALFTSNTEIGNFYVAVNFTALIAPLTYPMNALFPAFSKVKPESDEAKHLFKLSVKYASLLIVPATIAAIVLSRDLVSFIYGSAYVLAPTLFSIYSLQFLYVGIGSIVLGYFLSGGGKTKTIFKASLINLSIFIPLASMLTWLYGIPGGMAAFSTSSLLSLIYQLSMARKLGVDFNPRDSLKIYLASVISAIPTLVFLRLSPLNILPNLIIGGSVFFLTYLTFTPIIGAITHNDLQNLSFILSKIKFVWPILKLLMWYENKFLSTVSPPAQSRP